MIFNINVWLKYYHKVHELGEKLRDSKVDAEGNPAKVDMSKSEQDDIQTEIDNLMKRTALYLNVCEMKPRKPLWHYNRLDESTWLSSTKFKYAHLVKNY